MKKPEDQVACLSTTLQQVDCGRPVEAKGVEVQVPTDPYKPSQRERGVIQAQIARDRNALPTPRVRFVEDESHRWRWEPDHPDLSVSVYSLGP
jgi:hypothetical protein